MYFVRGPIYLFAELSGNRKIQIRFDWDVIKNRADRIREVNGNTKVLRSKEQESNERPNYK